MQLPQVFVVRARGTGYVVHALNSEMTQYYPSKQEAIEHALFMLRWLGHTGEPVYTHTASDELHVTFTRSRHSTWDLTEL